MINVIFNQFNYEISNKKAEIFEKYNKIIQWGRRNPVKFMEFFFNLEFTDHQKYILLSTWYTKTAVWLMSRNSGKAICVDTLIPMYNQENKSILNFKNLVDVRIGDFIYDENGEPTEVIHLNPIIFDDVFEVEFEDGEIIECNAEHLWSFMFWDGNGELQKKILDTQSWIKTKGVSLYCKSYNFDDNSVFLKEVKRIEKKKDINGNYIKKPMRCITVSNNSGLFLCGKHATVTHNSYLSSPYIMARSILIPNHKTFILCPAGNQAQETFGKMEDLAKGQIASVTGATSVFWDELKRSTGTSDGFVHDKISHHCELYNGSEVRTVNSVPKNIVGIRSNLNFYDEAGKIDRDFFALTEPFTSQDTNFRTGKNLNIKCFPRQLPNQILYSSSAESMDSQLYDQYKMCAMKMIAGDDDYFVCDISCELSLHPMKDGKPYMPLLDQAKVDDAIKKNSYRAQREYFNKFDLSGGQDALIKRTTIIANSFSYHPELKNEDNESIYIITYDPSSKIDNSFILINKLIEDKEKGFMLKIVAAYNLRKKAESGKLISMQKPEQIEKLKEILLRYNGNNVDYDNIARIIIDAGSGGGGFDISQFLLRDWVDSSGKRHLGLIDLNDKYLAEEKNKFPGAIDKLTLANFTADKVKMYTNCQDMINQGLVMFPKSLNFNNEMEIELEDSEGKITFAYEPMDEEEVRILTEIDLLKEELIGIQKMKNNGVVRYDTLPSKKAQGMHDDRSDCCAMACHFLANLRKETLLNVEVKIDNKFEKLFSHSKGMKSNFMNLNQNQVNPFLNEGPNPFLR